MQRYCLKPLATILHYQNLHSTMLLITHCISVQDCEHSKVSLSTGFKLVQQDESKACNQSAVYVLHNRASVVVLCSKYLKAGLANQDGRKQLVGSHSSKHISLIIHFASIHLQPKMEQGYRSCCIWRMWAAINCKQTLLEQGSDWRSTCKQPCDCTAQARKLSDGVCTAPNQQP